MTNAGPSTATGVTIFDEIPADFAPTAVAGPPGFTCTAATPGATMACSGGSIPSGGAATLTVTGTVAANPSSLTLTNVAGFRAATRDPNLVNNTDTAVVQATPLADLAVGKVWGTPTGDFVPLTNTAPNTNVRVLMTITNLGPSPATGVTLRDALPAGATYVSDNQGACTNAAGVVTCIVGSLAVNASFSVLVTVQVAASAAGTTLVNTATKSANQPDPVASNDNSTDRLSVGTAADLELHKTVSPTNASVGDDVTYSLAVTNNGPSPTTSLTVVDPLPSGLEFVSAQAGCSYAAGTRQLTCTSGPLAVGVTRTLTFVARPTNAAAGTTVQNRATASSTAQDAEPANNVDFAALPVAPRADLRIVKRPADTTLRVDQDVTYTLTATNDGPNDATGVVVTDSVPTGMRFVSASPGCIYDAGPPETVTCAVGDLADGASTEVMVTLRPRRALAGEIVPNAGTVRGDQPDPNLADNSDVTSVIVLAQADLQLVKSAASPTAVAGGTLTYTLSVFNEGPSTAPTTTVEDRLPAGVEVRSATPSQGTCTIVTARVTCALGALASGVTAQVLVVVEVPGRCGRQHARKLRHGRRRDPRSPPAGQRSVRLDTGRQRVDLAPPAAAGTRVAAAAGTGRIASVHHHQDRRPRKRRYCDRARPTRSRSPTAAPRPRGRSSSAIRSAIA